MPRTTPDLVTRLLADSGRGEPAAAEELLPLVYGELRKLARARMAREPAGQTLQPTALVHEAYLRLVGDASPPWESRAQFFAAAAEAMRRILIERARRAGRQKRGGRPQRVTLEEGLLRAEPSPEEVLALDQALGRLEARDPAMARVVKLRTFAGLTVEETALALGTSPRTVKRLWTAGRAWLHRELTRSPPAAGRPPMPPDEARGGGRQGHG